MKTKSFKNYLEKRLDKNEIAEIKQQAQFEIKMLKSIAKEPKDVFKNKK